MRMRIQFSRATVKDLEAAWQRALARGDRRVVRRATALLLLACGQPPSSVAAQVGQSRATISAWLRAFMVRGLASLAYCASPGRPAKLTKGQKERLAALVTASPEAAGYATGCWHSALVQALIEREFGVLYSRQ
jgi:transposase